MSFVLSGNTCSSCGFTWSVVIFAGNGSSRHRDLREAGGELYGDLRGINGQGVGGSVNKGSSVKPIEKHV